MSPLVRLWESGRIGYASRQLVTPTSSRLGINKSRITRRSGGVFRRWDWLVPLVGITKSRPRRVGGDTRALPGFEVTLSPVRRIYPVASGKDQAAAG